MRALDLPLMIAAFSGALFGAALRAYFGEDGSLWSFVDSGSVAVFLYLWAASIRA